MVRRVAVLGGGPIGLDAALAFTDAGWDVTVLETGPTVGSSVRAWGHVRLFTPWSMNVSDRMRRHVDAPDGAVCPTGHELADGLLEPVAAVLGDAVHTGVRVLGVGRHGLLKHEAIGGATRAGAPFRLLLTDGSREWTADADLVLDATGTYATPNALGDGGLPAPGERALGDRVVRHLPDLDAGDWDGLRVLLVGAGKSAQTAARDLAARGVSTLWAVRDPDPDWGAIPDDPLPERQELVDAAIGMRAGEVPAVTVWTGAQVATLAAADDGAVGARVVVDGAGADVSVDRVLALTGYAGDPAVYRQLQVHECYATGAPMNLAAALLAAGGDGTDGSPPADCLAQPAQGVDVLRSPEPDFFVLGAKSYGRSSAFLLRVGYEQVDEVVAAYPAGRARQPA